MRLWPKARTLSTMSTLKATIGELINGSSTKTWSGMINKMTEELGKRKVMEEEEKNEGAGFLENDEDAGMDEKQVTMHEQATKIKTIEWVQIGKFKCETWYFSPYPEQYHHID
mmetsp:Transcript_19229/g.18908  ORF Transcript_19229/g.18908 Transcript_19229/m.18908 type:complete len:113 (-) Transcript_19229:821-1159(-)